MATKTIEQLKALAEETNPGTVTIAASAIMRGDELAGLKVTNVSRKRVNVVLTFEDGSGRLLPLNKNVEVVRSFRTTSASEAWRELVIADMIDRLPDFQQVTMTPESVRRSISWNLEEMVSNERKAEVKRVALRIASDSDISTWNQVATRLIEQLMDNVLSWSGSRSTSRSTNLVGEVNHETDVELLKELRQNVKVAEALG